MKTIGTCLMCGKTRQIHETTPTMVKGRREGYCEECEAKLPKRKARLTVRYKQTKP